MNGTAGATPSGVGPDRRRDAGGRGQARCAMRADGVARDSRIVEGTARCGDNDGVEMTNSAVRLSDLERCAVKCDCRGLGMKAVRA